MTKERTCLYRMYDAVGALLYIGITNRPDLRFRQHAADKPWWPDVKRITKTWYPVRECTPDLLASGCQAPLCAGHAEIRAIRVERPRYNIEHNLANPNRVAYRKLSTPAHPVRARRRRGKIKRMDIRGWAWITVCAVLMALTGAMGVGVGIIGLCVVFLARVLWIMYLAPALSNLADGWRTVRQRK